MKARGPKRGASEIERVDKRGQCKCSACLKLNARVQA